ncbi:unnamed protein product [Chondrus crispus]|uniref:Fatty acid hydroxylase domain-containing protein n=1 Tax=Chondrus crispus TaxID=2769 RepID=R7QP06_CHOCR|nr:unnamed protein product [Chondrus crispus]CDF39221.1 unnamed protein product [Chondrus crispus]|eukprot:XP_005719132.1 unnamed protein product [Chondrus crispus]
MIVELMRRMLQYHWPMAALISFSRTTIGQQCDQRSCVTWTGCPKGCGVLAASSQLFFVLYHLSPTPAVCGSPLLNWQVAGAPPAPQNIQPLIPSPSSTLHPPSLRPSLTPPPHAAMEAVGLVARLENLNAHDFIQMLSDHLVDRVYPCEGPMTLLRRICITWLFLYLGSLVVYFLFATLDYLIYHKLLARQILPDGYDKTVEIRREIYMSVTSLAIMAGLSVPGEILVHLGYSKVYTDPAEHGYVYLCMSPILFIAFSDCLIYFLHRGLHHPRLYKHIHKPHHSFINTTPFAAFAFHPLDGYTQGMPYQIFVFLFPFHSAAHLISLIFVSMWTINIHDRATFGIPGVNGAAHHTIHHTTFKSNYGQYFTLWDKICGTFKDPRLWKKAGAPVMSEKEVYGKDA